MTTIKFAMLLGFVAAPLTVICGLTMFRYPEAWAKGNARIARKELSQFNSPKQLEHTKKVGALFMAAGALDFVCMIWLIAMPSLMKWAQHP